MIEVGIMAVIVLLLAVFSPGIAKLGLRGLAVIAMLVALASAGRAIFAPIPSVQPASFIIIFCGMSLGPGAGLVCGVLTAVLSSALTSFGPFTLWQALLWGVMGLLSVCLKRSPFWVRALYGFAWGFVFGWIMNLWWYSFGIIPLTWETFFLACTMSFYFDLMHALTNAVLLALLSHGSMKVLGRFMKQGPTI